MSKKEWIEGEHEWSQLNMSKQMPNLQKKKAGKD